MKVITLGINESFHREKSQQEMLEWSIQKCYSLASQKPDIIVFPEVLFRMPPFDMKNWNGEFSKVKNDILPKIIKKAESVGARAIFIINILKNDYLDNHHIIYEKDYVYEIPWLYDHINNQYNEEAIELIKGAVLKYGDIDE